MVVCGEMNKRWRWPSRGLFRKANSRLNFVPGYQGSVSGTSIPDQEVYMKTGVFQSDVSMSLLLRRGFTVPEILAVVAIITIILSILLPSLGQSRDVTFSAICRSQLHQHMVAAKTYSIDNSRMLPLMRGNQKIKGVTKTYNYSDRLVLFNYLEAYEIFYCPAQDVNKYYKRSAPSVSPFFDGGIRLDYGINHYGRGDGRTDLYFDTLGQHYDNTNSPWASGTLRSNDVANQDAICYSDADGDSSPWDIGGAKRGQKVWPMQVSFEVHAYKRHLNGYNAVSLDTSAKWRPADKPSYQDWYLKRGASNPHRP